MEYYQIGDTVEFGPKSGYEHRADMRGQIMVALDERVPLDYTLMIKDGKIVECLYIFDGETLERVRDMLADEEFDAILVHPDSVPEQAWNSAAAGTQADNRSRLS